MCENDMDFNDRNNFWMQSSENKELMQDFSVEEQNIINMIYRSRIIVTEVVRDLHEKKGQSESGYRKLAEGKEMAFLLKAHLTEKINALMSERTIEAWEEIAGWYSLSENTTCNYFYEFAILGKMVFVFMEERDALQDRGGQISILSVSNMQELVDIYLKIVFLCRRIEFGIEPVGEIVEYIKEKNFSHTFIEGILKRAMIYDTGKVMKVLEGWCWK